MIALTNIIVSIRLNSTHVPFDFITMVFESSSSSSSSSDSLVLGRELGDEIIEWNGRSLHGRSAQEVHEIVTDIGNDFHQIELIVSRLLVAPRGERTSSQQRSIQQSGRSYSPFRYTRGIPCRSCCCCSAPSTPSSTSDLPPNNNSEPKTEHNKKRGWFLKGKFFVSGSNNSVPH